MIFFFVSSVNSFISDGNLDIRLPSKNIYKIKALIYVQMAGYWHADRRDFWFSCWKYCSCVSDYSDLFRFVGRSFFAFRNSDHLRNPNAVKMLDSLD